MSNNVICQPATVTDCLLKNCGYIISLLMEERLSERNKRNVTTRVRTETLTGFLR